MKIINKVKSNDCCICAYAMCEGVTWKVSKRRLRKHLKSKKILSVSSHSVRDVGISGYSVLTKGGFNTVNEMFNFGAGILFLSWGNGLAHAIFWNGYKFIDNEASGKWHNKKTLGVLSTGESINLILRKNKRGLLLKFKSFIAMHLVKHNIL